MAGSSSARGSKASASSAAPSQGVIVFDTAEDERVVSVERLTEEGEENGG